MRISDWSSDVCSSDLRVFGGQHGRQDSERRQELGCRESHRPKVARPRKSGQSAARRGVAQPGSASALGAEGRRFESCLPDHLLKLVGFRGFREVQCDTKPSSHASERSEEHTSALQSLIRISYAVFFLKNKK